MPKREPVHASKSGRLTYSTKEAFDAMNALPNQPGSAPSKRVSAASVLAEWERNRITSAEGDTIRVALRLLARVEEEGATKLRERGAEIGCDEYDNHPSVGARCACTLLSDLAALVAPTDAEGK